jgi:hypothetical protein
MLNAGRNLSSCKRLLENQLNRTPNNASPIHIAFTLLQSPSARSM